MRKKLYVALCGIPDCGKSTFIKNFVKLMTDRDVSVDSLCDEEVKEMTIRSAQIVCRPSDFEYDIVFLDCPGHLELEDEIKSCLTKCHMVIILNNCNDSIDDSETYKWHIVNTYENVRDHAASNKVMELYSHAKKALKSGAANTTYFYDVDVKESMEQCFTAVLNEIDLYAKYNAVLTNPEKTAKRIISQTVSNAVNPAAMVSYGKDSIVMLAIAKELGLEKKIHWYYPVSGFDMDGLSEEFIKSVNEHFGVEIEPYRVIPDDPEWTFENKTVQQMMIKKAEMLNEQIAKNKHDFCLMGIRRDEEGVRAKEKFFSIRQNDGSANLYEQQYERFGDELNGVVIGKEGTHIRVHPLLDVTEADAWLYILWHGLPYCSEYVSKNGKRFRSLGDKPITSPIDSDATTLEEIVNEVTWTLVPERACRAAQDNAVKGNMEIIRSKGFF